MRKVLALLLSLVMTLTLLVPATWAEEKPAAGYQLPASLKGKTVILHTNDVHGAIDKYAKVAALKNECYDRGASAVVLLDAGDFSQGSTYVSLSKGATAVELMNAVGYDAVTLGNHEFDYGFPQLKANLSYSAADFLVTCVNLVDDKGDPIFAPGATAPVTDADDNPLFNLTVMGVATPETQTKANPALMKGLTFLSGQKLYDAANAGIKVAREEGNADIVIALTHLGVDASSEPNRSIDFVKNVPDVDIVIDGHSHTVMTANKDNGMIQSTGTGLAYVGAFVIDNATKSVESNGLIDLSTYTKEDASVKAIADRIIGEVDAEYGKVFAKTEVELNGAKEPGNRTEETNMGDLITDAMMWAVKTRMPSINMENAVAITNGGGIRAAIKAGDITKKDVFTVLPFGNTLTVVNVTGAELLEALEASTFCTPVSLGGFPQTAGMKLTVDCTKDYDKNDTTYPGSTYYGPKSINRVTIESINGKPFDKDATYSVITNNFCAAGGDTYYAFAAASSQIESGLSLDTVVMDYITDELGGTVTKAQYGEPQGRMTIIPPEKTDDGKITIGGLDANVWMTKYGNVYTDCKAEDFMGKLGFAWGDLVTVKFLDKTLTLPVVPTYSYVDSGKPAVIVEKDADGKPTGYVSMAINMGNFAETYELAKKHTNEDKTWYWTAWEGVTYPVEVTFKMAEKGGYMAEYIMHDLQRTNDRADYPDLSDAEFGNFRNIATTGMGKDVLYRGSSPINPELGRNTYVDAALKQAGVNVIMNLANSQEEAEAYEGFADTYYSGQKVIYLNLGVDFSAPEFQKGLAEGLRFFAANKGTYYVHCTEGNDRAGFVSALLECLMGATYDEVVADYMVTYYNYYGVEPGTDKYNAIANSNIIKTLQNAFGVEDLSKADLQKGAKDYMKAIGLTDAEITDLMVNLGYVAPVEPVTPSKPATGDAGIVVYLGLGVMALAGGVLVAKKKEQF